MDSGKARHLYVKYAGTMAYVAVEAPDGTPGIGSAFHVGEGVFVTARHVVEKMLIVEVACTERSRIRLEGDAAVGARVFLNDGTEEHPVHIVDNGVLQIESGPFFHPDPQVDIAVFRVGNLDSRTPHARLGTHLDDWLGKSDFVLSEVIVLGFPPIPFTREPHLVAARAEVNAQIDLRGAPHVHYVLSSMSRGGFSGGLVLAEDEFVLGIVTSSLLTDHKLSELGFFTVLTVEPIYACLAEHKLLPSCQTEGWDDFWNLDNVADFYRPDGSNAPNSYSAEASISIFDDAKRYYVEVRCDRNAELLEEVLTWVESELTPCMPRRVQVRPGMVKIEASEPSNNVRELLLSASHAAAEVLVAGGLVAVYRKA